MCMTALRATWWSLWAIQSGSSTYDFISCFHGLYRSLLPPDTDFVILLQIKYEPKSLLRGVILDKALGNLISIDAERKVQVRPPSTLGLTRKQVLAIMFDTVFTFRHCTVPFNSDLLEKRLKTRN